VTQPIKLAQLDLDSLADYCVEHTKKFLQRLSNDTRYCFELMRRAYAELSDEALNHVYTIYLPQLSSRAKRHKQFDRSCGDSDYFARLAMTNFYSRCHGSNFSEMFSELPAVMGYLKACLHSVIVQDVRENALIVSLPDDLPAPLSTDRWNAMHISEEEIWAHIGRLLSDPKDERLAYLRWVLEIPPAQIVQLDPQQWKSEREVSVALQRIRRRLRKDLRLRELVSV
jgi:hypothetical protein